jgi:heme-degrading monooxygenase HmoA
MTIALIVFRAKPGQGAALVAFLRDNQPKLLGFRGFRAIQLLRDEHDPDRVIELEEWDSAADHQAMVAAVGEAGGWDALDALVASEPEATYLSTIATLRV